MPLVLQEENPGTFSSCRHLSRHLHVYRLTSTLFGEVLPSPSRRTEPEGSALRADRHHLGA